MLSDEKQTTVTEQDTCVEIKKNNLYDKRNKCR